jgi:hypothetical protein
MQTQEPSTDNERQVHKEDSRLRTASCGDTGGVGEYCVDGGSRQDKPKMRRLMAPFEIKVRELDEYTETDDGQQ